MKILLGLPATSLGKRSYCGFKDEYHGVSVNPLYAGSFGWYWIKALRQLGHTVETATIFQSAVGNERPVLLSWSDSFKKRLGIKKWCAQKTGSILFAKCKEYNPDLVIVDSGYLLSAQALARIKEELRIPLVSWLLDDPVRQGLKNVVDSFPLYDCIFTFDPYYVPEYLKLGARRVEYLPCACDPDIYHHIHNETLLYDLCFVGTVTAHRRELLLGLTDFDLNIWTRESHTLPEQLKDPKHLKGKAFGEDINTIYNASRIALNFHHPQSYFGTNMRTFEIACSGTFQLVDEKQELSKLFRLGEELICYHSMEELRTLIRYYLDHPEERSVYAGKALKRAQGEHTYVHRFRRLLEVAASL